MRRWKTAAVVVLAAVAFAGGACGSSKESATTTTASETSTTAASTPSTHPSSSTTKAQPGAPGGGSVRHVNDITMFHSPTGNIGCAIGPDNARCDVRERDWTPPAKPASCQFDYGHGIEVGPTGAARYVCAGDTAFDPSSADLAYGDSIQAGVMLCTSTRSGMECKSTSSGHGFAISREAHNIS